MPEAMSSNKKIPSALLRASVADMSARSYHLTGGESYYGRKPKFKGKNEFFLQFFYNALLGQSFFNS
jgi:hypothetical protein